MMIRDTSAQDRLVEVKPNRKRQLILAGAGVLVLALLAWLAPGIGRLFSASGVGQQFAPGVCHGRARPVRARHRCRGQGGRRGEPHPVRHLRRRRDAQGARRRHGQEGPGAGHHRQPRADQQAGAGTEQRRRDGSGIPACPDRCAQAARRTAEGLRQRQDRRSRPPSAIWIATRRRSPRAPCPAWTSTAPRTRWTRRNITAAARQVRPGHGQRQPQLRHPVQEARARAPAAAGRRICSARSTTST